MLAVICMHLGVPVARERSTAGSRGLASTASKKNGCLHAVQKFIMERVWASCSRLIPTALVCWLWGVGQRGLLCCSLVMLSQEDGLSPGSKVPGLRADAIRETRLWWSGPGPGR